jgi:hypothetical protein
MREYMAGVGCVASGRTFFCLEGGMMSRLEYPVSLLFAIRFVLRIVLIPVSWSVWFLLWCFCLFTPRPVLSLRNLCPILRTSGLCPSRCTYMRSVPCIVQVLYRRILWMTG